MRRLHLGVIYARLIHEAKAKQEAAVLEAQA